MQHTSYHTDCLSVNSIFITSAAGIACSVPCYPCSWNNMQCTSLITLNECHCSLPLLGMGFPLSHLFCCFVFDCFLLICKTHSFFVHSFFHFHFVWFIDSFFHSFPPSLHWSTPLSTDLRWPVSYLSRLVLCQYVSIYSIVVNQLHALNLLHLQLE